VALDSKSPTYKDVLDAFSSAGAPLAGAAAALAAGAGAFVAAAAAGGFAVVVDIFIFHARIKVLIKVVQDERVGEIRAFY
jgi:hypothetical protein